MKKLVSMANRDISTPLNGLFKGGYATSGSDGTLAATRLFACTLKFRFYSGSRFIVVRLRTRRLSRFTRDVLINWHVARASSAANIDSLPGNNVATDGRDLRGLF